MDIMVNYSLNFASPVAAISLLSLTREKGWETNIQKKATHFIMRGVTSDFKGCPFPPYVVRRIW